jgi:glycosyltransferase involved in cell wall biosynthesis
MPPEVSAIITTHARPVAVCEAIASVQAETQGNVEVIVVDDGDSFVPTAACGAGVRIVRGSGLGVARARNLGLSAARGEYSIFLDDDDVALPNRIADLLDAARRHQADLCFGMTRRVLDGGAATDLPDVPTHIPIGGAIGFGDLLNCTPHVNAVLVKTETLRAVGGFDADVVHFDDWAAWLRIADRGVTMWSITAPVAEWRLHLEGLSGKVLQVRAMKSLLLALFAHLAELLSPAGAGAIATARQVVATKDIVTYDDYVAAMAKERDGRHVDDSCRRLPVR